MDSRSYAQPGDRAEMPNGEVGTVLEVLGTAKRRNGREVQMLQVATPNGPRIWASDDLASLARDLPSKVNPDNEGAVADSAMKGFRFQVIPVHTYDRFPIDMLRYDSCWPETEQDSVEISATLFRWSDPLHQRTGTPVNLYSAHTPPTPERWETFGWRVVASSVRKIQ
jgi:hypothetical protein